MKMRIAAICLILALLLCGCTESGRTPNPNVPNVTLPAPTAADTTPPTTVPEPVTEPAVDPAEPEASTEPEPTAAPETTAPEPTAPENFVPDWEDDEIFGLRAGMLIKTSTGVYSAEDDGIYRWKNGEAELVYNPHWNYARNIACDGENVCYIDDDGCLVRVYLEEGNVALKTDPFPGDVSLVGAWYTYVFLDSWAGENEWGPDNYQVDIYTGTADLMDDMYNIYNQEGFLVVREFATDVSPKATWIFSPDGEMILEGVRTWNNGISNGMLWYAETDADYGQNGKYQDSGIHLRGWNGSTWIELVERTDAGSDYGAAYVGSFYKAYSNEGFGAWDVSTNAPLTGAMLEMAGETFNAFRFDGTDYYAGYGCLYRIDANGQPELVISRDHYGYWFDCVVDDCFYFLTDNGVVAQQLG